MKWTRLTVLDIVKETEDSVSVLFDNTDQLSFIPGQYLTCKAIINDEEVRRSYSLSGQPNEDHLRIGVKKVEEGLFSTYANKVLKAGDTIDVLQPTGSFTIDDEKEDGHLVLIAAGSGITPILSIAKYWLAKNEANSVSLIYGNRKSTSIMYHEELEELKNLYVQRFQLFHTFSKEAIGPSIGRGRITKEKVDKILTLLSPTDFKTSEFFMCGPQDMTMELIEYFKDKEVPKKHIHFELFTTNTAKSGKKKTIEKKPLDQRVLKAKVTVKIDGDQLLYSHFEDSGVILDAAAETGADLPYACKGGVCSTCKAKVTKGKVSMDVNFALEEDELAHGFVLTCQAHPITDEVTIDFDDLTFHK